MTRWIARRIWGWMLWSIRRPYSRRMQRWLIDRIPANRREKARANMVKQEKFARKIGLRTLTVVVNLFFVSVFTTALLTFFLTATAEGWLTIPTREALNLDQPQSQSPVAPAR